MIGRSVTPAPSRESCLKQICIGIFACGILTVSIIHQIEAIRFFVANLLPHIKTNCRAICRVFGNHSGIIIAGDSRIYDYDQVSSDFEISGIDYIVLYLVAFKLIWDLAVIIIDCVARIFNMLFLYLIAPPFIGVMPLDEGGKFKQWTTAFIVQCFGVFGTVIAMRVLLIFIPIVINSDLVLFESSTLNMVGKVVLILGGMSTAKRASGVVTGILADNAGMQAIHAGSMGDSVRQGMSKYSKS